MTTRFTMDAPHPRVLDRTVQGVIHRPLDRPEGPLKVTGQARYAAERELPGQVEGVLVRATIARGRVTGMNDDAVRGLPGVLGVFADDRFLRNPAQGGDGEAPVQGVTEVVYHGQPVALVVAETFEQARHAAAALTCATRRRRRRWTRTRQRRSTARTSGSSSRAISTAQWPRPMRRWT
jgi:xanthine dehydrogenase YagR molybdenum-binding subunit